MASWDSRHPLPTTHTVSAWSPIPSGTNERLWLPKVQKLQWSMNTIVFGLGVVSTISGYKTSSVVVTVCGVFAILGSFLWVLVLLPEKWPIIAQHYRSFLFTQISRARTETLDNRLRALEERLAHISSEAATAPNLPPPSPAYSPPAYYFEESQGALILSTSDSKTPTAVEDSDWEYPIIRLINHPFSDISNMRWQTCSLCQDSE